MKLNDRFNRTHTCLVMKTFVKLAKKSTFNTTLKSEGTSTCGKITHKQEAEENMKRTSQAGKFLWQHDNVLGLLTRGKPEDSIHASGCSIIRIVTSR